MEYKTRRGIAEYESEMRRQALIGKVPGLAELFDAKRDANLELLFSGAKNELGTSAKKTAVKEISSRIDELIAATGEVLPLPKYRCKICSDRGYIEENDIRRWCACFLQELYTGDYGAEDISTFSDISCYDTSIFDSADRARMTKLVDFLKNFAENFKTVQRKNIIFSGKAGAGKTFLCRSLAASAKTNDKMFIPAFNMFEVFHRDRLGEEINLAPFFSCEMLIIDDLGAEPLTTNVTREYLANLLDTRQKNKLATVFSTNLGADIIRDRYLDRIASRLFSAENTNVIVVPGGDKRYF